MKQIEIIIEPRNQDQDRISKLNISLPNQQNKLWIKARYFFLFGMRFGIVFHYE